MCTLRPIFFIIVCLLVAAPLHAEESIDQPSPAALKQRISASLPPYWAIDDLTVIANLNAGDVVNPRIKQRFEAIASPKAPLYLRDPRAEKAFAPFIPIVPTFGAKQTRTLYGVAVSTYSAGSWQINLNMENGVSGLGQPESVFNGPTLVRGSQNADRMRSMLVAGKAEQIKAQAQAAVERQKAEAAAKLRQIKAANATKIDELKQQLAANRRDYERQIEAAKTTHDDAVKALREQQNRKIKMLKDNNARTLATIRQGYDHKIEALKQATKKTNTLTALQQKENEAASRLAAQQQAAITQRTHHQHALISKFRQAFAAGDADTRQSALAAALASDNPGLRQTAINAALKADDAGMRRTAIEAGLASDQDALRTVAIDAALGGGDPIAQHLVLTSLLSTKTSLTGKATRRDDVYSIAVQISKFDPASGEIVSKIPGWQGCEQTLNGALARTALALRSDRGCGLQVSLSEKDTLAGSLTDRYGHKYAVQINVGH